jgi:hypothetical protein
VALVLVTGTPAAAHAAPQPRFAANFRGSAVGYLATPECWYSQQTFRARFVDSRGGRGNFKIDGCWNDTYEYSGTFWLDDDAGRHLGTVVGFLAGSSPTICLDTGQFGEEFDFVLTPQSGTPRNLQGYWCQVDPVFGVPFPIAGTLSA